MANDPMRYIGLDIHKEYFVAVGVNEKLEAIFGPQRVSNYQLDDWILRYLTPEDAVVLEMSTNTYQFYDALLPRVHSVLAVHSPNVAMVTNVRVKTDKKAALALAQLHAAGLLQSVDPAIPSARPALADCSAGEDGTPIDHRREPPALHATPPPPGYAGKTLCS